MTRIFLLSHLAATGNSRSLMLLLSLGLLADALWIDTP
jgi:hypothetical protein